MTLVNTAPTGFCIGNADPALLYSQYFESLSIMFFPSVPEPVREEEFYYQLGDQYYECVYDEESEYYEIHDHQTLPRTDTCSFPINVDNKPTEENSRHKTRADNPCKTQRNADDANDSAIENESVISVVTSSMHHEYCDRSLCVEDNCEQYSLSTEELNAIDPDYLQPSICSKKNNMRC